MRKRAGVTLAETMITMGLMSIVVGGAMYALMMSFRVNRVVQDELDMLDHTVLALSRIAGEAALSRGLVRFVPDGETAPKDGLSVRGGRIIVYEPDGRGALRRAVYGLHDSKLVDESRVGRGISYFEMVSLERGLQIKLQAGQDPSTGTPLPPERTVDMTTAVRPMSW